jgi:hypothetical protein
MILIPATSPWAFANGPPGVFGVEPQLANNPAILKPAIQPVNDAGAGGTGEPGCHVSGFAAALNAFSGNQ